MKKSVKSCIMAIGLMCVFGLTVACSAQGTPADIGNWTVVSPDEGIQVDIRLDGEGALTYSVHDGDVEVILPSELGFAIKQDDFRLFTVEGESERRITGSYENKSGKHKTVQYDCNEFTLTLKNYEYYLDVIMRAYDDG